MLGDTIKTDFGNNQFASAGYYLWASTKEGKKFHKRYGEGGRFGHVSVLFKVGSMDGKTEDGGTQPYYNEKGKEPIVIGAGKKSPLGDLAVK